MCMLTQIQNYCHVNCGYQWSYNILWKWSYGGFNEVMLSYNIMKNSDPPNSNWVCLK